MSKASKAKADKGKSHKLSMHRSSVSRKTVNNSPAQDGEWEKIRVFYEWSKSFKRVSKCMSKYNLEKLLDDNGGLVRISDFLPLNVAEGALSVLESIPISYWNSTSARDDPANNNISHSFLSIKQAPQECLGRELAALLRVFTMLLPEELNTFSAARYGYGHHIAPHVDRAYTDVLLEDGAITTCSRTVAVIYYLTRDWRAEEGGCLVDAEGGKTFVPQFNSVVAFRVPRLHEVTKVLASRPRFSVFGWFLRPGKLYELQLGGGVSEEPAPGEVGTVREEEAPELPCAQGEGCGERESLFEHAGLKVEHETLEGTKRKRKRGARGGRFCVV